jgi:hypothetical protein
LNGPRGGILALLDAEQPGFMDHDLTAYARLADQLIEAATKEQLADVARLLAFNLGWHQERHGDVPQHVLLGMVRAEMLIGETKRWLRRGMQRLVAVRGRQFLPGV